MKKFIATYVETSDTCDGRPRVLGVYDTKIDAAFRVNYDMDMWYNDTHYGEDLDHEIDHSKMTARVGDNECIWNIEEIEI